MTNPTSLSSTAPNLRSPPSNNNNNTYPILLPPLQKELSESWLTQYRTLKTIIRGIKLLLTSSSQNFPYTFLYCLTILQGIRKSCAWTNPLPVYRRQFLQLESVCGRSGVQRGVYRRGVVQGGDSEDLAVQWCQKVAGVRELVPRLFL